MMLWLHLSVSHSLRESAGKVIVLAWMNKASVVICLVD
jgi:hypothetical protein